MFRNRKDAWTVTMENIQLAMIPQIHRSILSVSPREIDKCVNMSIPVAFSQNDTVTEQQRTNCTSFFIHNKYFKSNIKQNHKFISTQQSRPICN